MRTTHALVGALALVAFGTHAATSGLSSRHEPGAGDGWIGAQLALTDLDSLDGITPAVWGWEFLGDNGGYNNADGAVVYNIPKPPGFFDYFIGVATTDVGYIEGGSYQSKMAFWLSPRSAVTATLAVKGFVSTGDFGQLAAVNAQIALIVADPESPTDVVELSSVVDSMSLQVPFGAAASFFSQAATLQVAVENPGANPMRLAFSENRFVMAETRLSPGQGAIDALPVPEPGTWLMMLLGLHGLFLMHRGRGAQYTAALSSDIRSIAYSSTERSGLRSWLRIGTVRSVTLGCSV